MTKRIATLGLVLLLTGCAGEQASPPRSHGVTACYTVRDDAGLGVIRAVGLNGNTIIQMRDNSDGGLEILTPSGRAVKFDRSGRHYLTVKGLHHELDVVVLAHPGMSSITAEGIAATPSVPIVASSGSTMKRPQATRELAPDELAPEVPDSALDSVASGAKTEPARPVPDQGHPGKNDLAQADAVPSSPPAVNAGKKSATAGIEKEPSLPKAGADTHKPASGKGKSDVPAIANASKSHAPDAIPTPGARDVIPSPRIVPSRKETWSLCANRSIVEQLQEWSKRAGWRLVWQAGDWIAASDESFTGDFGDALSDVVKALASAGANIQLVLYSNNVAVVGTKVEVTLR